MFMNTKSGGFTLVEVLVAVVVLAIGLLGMAGLQVAGLHYNHNAYLRAQATLLASDIAERMKANPVGVQAGNYDNPTAAGTQADDCLTTTGCAAAAMAGHDFYEWNNALSTRLPNGKGVVCIDDDPADGTFAAPACTAGAGAAYAIKVWWDDDLAEGDTQMFVTSFRP
jgi:type IV pilus assembly protein PilV